MHFLDNIASLKKQINGCSLAKRGREVDITTRSFNKWVHYNDREKSYLSINRNEIKISSDQFLLHACFNLLII